MRNNTVKGLLLDSANALRNGRGALALRLARLAASIADGDRDMCEARRVKIRAAVAAIALAI